MKKSRTPRPAPAAAPGPVYLCADFTAVGDRSFRFAEEIRGLASQGRDVWLVQVRAPMQGAFIAAEIATCLRRGLARIAPDQGMPDGARVILHQPALADWSLPALREPAAETTLVCHDAGDLAAALSRRAKGRPATIAVTNPFIARDLAEGRSTTLLWLPPMPVPQRGENGPARQRIAWYGQPADSASEAIDLRAPGPLGTPSLPRCVAACRALVLPGDVTAEDLPDTLVAAFLAAGRTVVAPAWLKPHYGAGPVYVAPGELPAALAELPAVPHRRPAKPAFLRRRSPIPAATETAPEATERPTLCLPSNGVGVGHLTRLLAIARRLPGPVVFASQATSLDIVEKMGFPVDYMPSAAQSGTAYPDWDRWFGHEIDRLLDRHDAGAVIYDGNHLSDGIVAAVAARRDCRLIWVRRGMWAKTTSPYLANASWCDAVIEPGELAQTLDTGVTSGLRDGAVVVPPVMLLDPAEQLPRDRARAELGLDPGRTAVLVQLGSGKNRDLVSLLDRIIGDLNRAGEVQVMVVEWLNAAVPLALWKNVRVLRGYPVARVLNAFDFTISAAGYNSYHELIAAGVPTVFLSDEHPTMDDQRARARHAQASAASFEIGEAELSELPAVLEMLMQKPARDYLAANCRAIRPPNGAVAAAETIRALLASPPPTGAPHP